MLGKTLIILRGISGAGKSTLAQLLMDTAGAVAFEADSYFYNDGNYEFHADELGRAHSFCQYQVQQSMVEKKPMIVVSNTSTTEKELKPYLELADKYQYRVISLIVENRNDTKSVHNVPVEVLERQENNLLKSIKLR